MVISYDDATDEDDDEYAYNNLGDRNLMRNRSLEQSLDYFRKVLSGMHITVPECMLEAAERDRQANKLSGRHVYDASGKTLPR